MDIHQIMNSPAMWFACSLAVLLILAQATVFGVQAYKEGRRLGMQKKQLNSAIRSSAITSIGPSVVILTSMLSLLVSVGGPMAWMRLSVIGSVMFESMAAGFGAASVGVTLGGEEMTELAFTMAVWTMILGSIGWVLFGTFSATRMDKVEKKVSGGDPKVMTLVAGSAVVGSFAALSSQHLVRLNKNAIAVVLGGLITFVVLTIAEKTGKKRLKEWALTIAILGTVFICAVLP